MFFSCLFKFVQKFSQLGMLFHHCEPFEECHCRGCCPGRIVWYPSLHLSIVRHWNAVCWIYFALKSTQLVKDPDQHRSSLCMQTFSIPLGLFVKQFFVHWEIWGINAVNVNIRATMQMRPRCICQLIFSIVWWTVMLPFIAPVLDRSGFWFSLQSGRHLLCRSATRGRNKCRFGHPGILPHVLAG